MEYTYKWLDPEDYNQIAPFFNAENCPVPDPNFSRVLAAFAPSGELAGFIVLQLVAHAEPIYVAPEHRQSGLGTILTQAMDGYAATVGVAGLYTQPTNTAASRLCEKVGFTEAEYPLWVKVYDSNFRGIIPQQEVD